MKIAKRLLQVFYHDTSGLFSNYFLDDVRSGEYSSKEIAWAFRKGFAPSTARLLKIKDSNVGNYLSERNYFAGHPYNRWSVLRINDKLTYKYTLSKFDEFLPKYYFLITRTGDILPLPDCPDTVSDTTALESFLTRQGPLVVKRLGGCGGDGFYLVKKTEEGILVNGCQVEFDEWMRELLSSDYEFVITETVIPHSKYGVVWPQGLHCIRLQTVTIDAKPELLFGFIRFGCSQSECYTGHTFGGSVFGDVNLQDGAVRNLYRVEDGQIVEYPYHPDTRISAGGVVPHWELIKSKLLEMHRYLADLEYLGWDIAVTQDGFKVLEINTLTGIQAVQFFHPVMLDQRMKDFFEKHLGK